ncbi:MAG TPA: hypothetical protein VF021_10555 [Longimicrobiales bacterium]
MQRAWMAVVVAAAVSPSVSIAQQQQPAMQPGVVVVSYQKCAFDKLPEFNQFWKQTVGPLLDEQVKQGKLLSWGMLEHSWGDEWNSVLYYTARDLNTFDSSFGEVFSRLLQKEPNLMQRFSTWCTEHKDNIYSVVATNTVNPPR